MIRQNTCIISTIQLQGLFPGEAVYGLVWDVPACYRWLTKVLRLRGELE